MVSPDRASDLPKSTNDTTNFAMFVQSIQHELPDDSKLSVFDVLTLCKVRDGTKCPHDQAVTEKLVKLGFLEKHGKTSAVYYILP